MPLKLSGKLVCDDGGITVQGEVEDLSMNGVFLRAARTSEGLRGSEGALRLVFGEGEGAIHLQARARVMRETADGVGLKITEVELESYHHLRSLVLLNADSYDAARDEIEQHQGLLRK